MALPTQAPASLPPDPTVSRRSLPGRLVRDPRPYVWLVALVVVAPQFWHQLWVRGDLFVVDLHVYRLSGIDLLHHRPVYSWYYQTPTATLPFTYPPIAAVLAVPLALLPVRLDAVLWFLAVYALLAWVLRIVLVPVRARLRVESPRIEPFVLPALWAVCSFLVPGVQQIHLGQVGVFLLALVVLDQLTPRTGRFRGVLTGLAAAIKLTPLVFVPVFLAARRWRVAAMTLAGFVGASLFAYVVAPATSTTFWTDTVLHSDRLGDNTDPTNQSIRGALLRSPLHGATGTVLWLALSVAVLAAGLLVTTRAYADGDQLLAVTVGGFLSCLLSPVAWIHHYVWIFLFLVWLLREGRWRLAAGTAVLWLLNWTGSTRHHVLDTGFVGAWWQVVGDVFCLYAVVVVAVLATRAWRRCGGRPGVRGLFVGPRADAASVAAPVAA